MTEIPAAVEAELARLRAENARLLRLLKMTSKQAASPGPAQAAFFDAYPGMVDDGSPPDVKVAFFGTLFGARTDVYAIRYDNSRTGRGGWVPAVRGGWRKGMKHEDADFLPLTPEVFAAHLKGEVHIGLYPLLDGDSCRWLAADFDGPDALADALMYVKAARALQVPVALEVSRSGVGAHAWVFFTAPVPAGTARRRQAGIPADAQQGDGVPGVGTDNCTAVAAYRLSVQAGNPLSERKLAQMFGRTSRRWARARITEARQSP